MISVTFSPKALLPLSAQKAIQDKLFADWKEEKDTSCANSPLRHTGTLDAISRYEKSCWFSTQDQRYGGKMWLRFLIALGDIPADLIVIVNQDVCKKVLSKESRWATERPAVGARKSERTLAIDQSPGKEVAPTGICHRLSDAKLARRTAKRLDKQMQEEEIKYQQGKSKMSMGAWRSLCEQVEAEWEEATRLSEAAGVEYTGRHGERHNVMGDRSSMNVALQLFMDRHPERRIAPQHPDAAMPWM
jgi:hypothetical protein